MNSNLWLHILCVGGAGALGALCRWGVSHGVHLALGNKWPYGTLVVNVLGCFLFGFLFAWLREAMEDAAHIRLLLLTGFMGAFTTFSTFAFDTYELSIRGAPLAPASNLILHVLLGMTAIVLGVNAGRAM